MSRRRIEIKRHKDGTPYVRPYLGRNKLTGKQIRPYKRFPKHYTDEQAMAAAQEWLELQTSAARYGVSGRLCEILESYIDTLECSGSPVNTVKTYRTTLRSYLEPNLGDMRVEDFTVPVAQGLYNIVLMQESKKGGTIQPDTVLKMHWFLSGAFKFMTANGLASFNPMPSVTHPQPSKKEALAFDQSDFAILSAFLADAMRCTDTSREAVFRRMCAFAAYIALWDGTRCGETCALLRDDAQFWRDVLHIWETVVEKPHEPPRIQTKTKGRKSRNIALYEDVAAEMRIHYRWQDTFLPPTSRPGRLTIITDNEGGLLRPSEVGRYFTEEICARLGLAKGSTFHTLRHTHATWLILQGADIVTVKERLGHSKESITLELYGHLMPGRDAAALEAFAEFAKRAGSEVPR